MMLLQAVDEHACAPATEQRQDKQQHGHWLATQGQGAQHLGNGEQQDGWPQGATVHRCDNGHDKGTDGDQHQDGQHRFPSSFPINWSIRSVYLLAVGVAGLLPWDAPSGIRPNTQQPGWRLSWTSQPPTRKTCYTC